VERSPRDGNEADVALLGGGSPEKNALAFIERDPVIASGRIGFTAKHFEFARPFREYCQKEIIGELAGELSANCAQASSLSWFK
jgi:hypothetical protein